MTAIDLANRAVALLKPRAVAEGWTVPVQLVGTDITVGGHHIDFFDDANGPGGKVHGERDRRLGKAQNDRIQLALRSTLVTVLYR